MWKEEAVWIGQQIRNLNFQQRPINCLNIGSSTKIYREQTKPYINEFVIEPIIQLGKISHLDAKGDCGVDIVGDITNFEFRRFLARNKYNLILCNNVLTHVKDVGSVYEIILNCLVDGGFVIITAPSQYPYCADPFDSKYRPLQIDIERMLPSLKTISHIRIKSSETLLQRFLLNKRLFLVFLINIIFPRKGWRVWKNTVSDILDLTKNFEVVGLVMQRVDHP